MRTAISDPMAAIAPTPTTINMVVLDVSEDAVGVAFGVTFPGGGVAIGFGVGVFGESGVVDCLFDD